MKFICPCASKGANSLMVVFILAFGIAVPVLLSFMGRRAESAELKRIAD